METYTKQITYEVDGNGNATAVVEHEFISPPNNPAKCIPIDPENRDYKKLLKDVVAGDAEIVDVDATVLPTFADKRQKPTSQGGYGTWQEQLEILGEQGIGTFQQHITNVKTAHPKPV